MRHQTFPGATFRDACVALLLSMSRYGHKGMVGSFTTYRLATFHDNRALQRLNEIRLYLLDPRVDAPIRAHARHRLRERHQPTNDIAMSDEVRHIKEDICVSLVVLFDIRDTRPTSVFLHSESQRI